jgi:cobalt/nickel transport protein
VKKWHYILLICILAALITAPVLLMPDRDYEGADNIAEEVIMAINPLYDPWIEPVWEPPSKEIESFLFAFQAAAGSAFIGFYLGKITTRRKNRG